MPANWSLMTTSLVETENVFNSRLAIEHITKTWPICLWFGGAYVLLVKWGQWFMKDKERFNLRIPLALWSGALAVFSITGTVRSAPELYDAVFNQGFRYSVCNPRYFLDGPSAFWSFVMLYSKFVELGDTAFIILRKQPLIFLHWYHHTTVMCYGTYSYGQLVATGRWYVVMNYAVHSVMYTYYTLKALRFHIPKQISMLITTSQILQMVVGIITNFAGLYYLKYSQNCRTSIENISLAFAMYTSYFILFAHFFYTVYVKSRPSKTKQMNGQNGTTHVVSNGVSNNNKKDR
ncbi:hypothetical protein CAPTEDRAFT_126391 [Capitella teleta]|uniref:Elongation of very long chain fatty acids protein n=1 Tax=Capitella teleta TaxID=283909 RepID=R7T4Z6_CAPTE|nr:hypothetical protein CAPTEDRAFT_126391 [Capitella teleta]|eukprot:ELT88011.1 hypothetical protein CAPTEDRAFT_126391 [Capitella teleta]